MKTPTKPSGSTPKLEALKRELRARGLTYKEVGLLVKPRAVTWSMVWAVLNGRRQSARVMDAVAKLLGGKDAA